MNWYYSENGGQAGPVSQGEFDALVQRGSITSDTMVWNEGMANWAPLRDVPSTSAALTANGTARCVECGQIFPASEVIVLEGQTVCGNCKPRFVQKLREGIVPSADLVYAGFGARWGAKVLDGIILFLVATLQGLLLSSVFGSGNQQGAIVSAALSLAIRVAYVTFFLGKFGATPGKMALKIRVVRPDGSPLTYGRAFGRFCAELLSALTLMIGYLMAAWDDQKRALHDRVADTRVIRQ